MFQYVEEENIDGLKAKVRDVMRSKVGLEVLHHPNTDETLLHRALRGSTVNMEIVTFLIQSFTDKQICTCQQVSYAAVLFTVVLPVLFTVVLSFSQLQNAAEYINSIFNVLVIVILLL